MLKSISLKPNFNINLFMLKVLIINGISVLIDSLICSSSLLSKFLPSSAAEKLFNMFSKFSSDSSFSFILGYVSPLRDKYDIKATTH